MSVQDILKGHFNELMNKKEELSARRLAICKTCPLGKQTQIGLVCDSSKWMNSKGETLNHPAEGYVRGCACRMSAKSRVEYAKCVAGRW